ncbi:O-methyltransferase [Sphingomonas paucimobilis]|nr:O-methyltransferase [Sphingomonas paucimobilis]
MSILTTSPIAPLLDRLFDEAEANAPWANPAFTGIPQEEIMRLMQSRTEYLHFYGEMRDYALPVSRETGKLLYMLARSMGAREIVEFGTSFGISTIHLAAALRENGGGRLITTEFEPSKLARARDNLEAAGLADLVEFRAGDALETLGANLPDAVDMLLLDGAKALYPDVLDRVEPRLRPGALIIADNADHCPDYLQRVRAAGSGYMSVPYGDDVELTMRLG